MWGFQKVSIELGIMHCGAFASPKIDSIQLDIYELYRIVLYYFILYYIRSHITLFLIIEEEANYSHHY